MIVDTYPNAGAYFCCFKRRIVLWKSLVTLLILLPFDVEQVSWINLLLISFDPLVAFL